MFMTCQGILTSSFMHKRSYAARCAKTLPSFSASTRRDSMADKERLDSSGCRFMNDVSHVSDATKTRFWFSTCATNATCNACAQQHERPLLLIN